MSSINGKADQTLLPPPAPPLPPPQKQKEKISIALKVREAPPGWAFEGHCDTPYWDGLTPPAGTYFFYGTLQDPDILREVLDLQPQTFIFRPAHMVGYKLRRWGQYPALVNEPGGVVHGLAFDVLDEPSAAKLAAYETSNYRPAPCLISVQDETNHEECIEGFVFKFCGNTNDLSDGTFDLNAWLTQMGRKRAVPS